MRLTYLPFFLTLVVLTANAAPSTSIQPPPIQTKEDDVKQQKNSAEESTLQATPAPEGPFRIQRRSLLSDASNNFGFGMASGKIDKEKESKTVTTFHAQRTQYNLDESAQEFGLTLTSNGFVGVDWGFKKFCCFTSFVSAFDPYYKIGFAGIYDPADKLANFIDYKRYFYQLSLGSEDLFFQRKSLRTEIGTRFGYPGFHFYAQIFYSFPD